MPYVTVLNTYPTTAAFYVSTTGNDSNAGTEASPWRTFRKASLTLTAGQSAIFEDGVYANEVNTSITGSGTATLPIVFKPRNPRGARLSYDTTGAPHIRIQTPYITIRDFEITATAQTASAQEYGIRAWDESFNRGASNYLIANNKIWNCNIAIKPNDLDGIVEDNDVTNGIDCVNSRRTIIRRNIVEVNLTGSYGILIKGGTHDARIYDNYIYTALVGATPNAILMGGATDTDSTHDPSGYEAYYCVAWNNIISTTSSSANWNIGMGMMSSTNCAYYNNVCVGANYPIVSMSNQGVSNGWTWNPPVNNPRWHNNVIYSPAGGNSDHYLSLGASESGTVAISRNLFRNVSSSGIANNIYETGTSPLVSPYSDWHLNSSSAAVDYGLTAAFTNSTGVAVDMSFDRDGIQRTVPWSAGVYAIP